MDSDFNIFLNALRKAIDNDPNQFNRAKTDPMYDAFRPQVNALLNKMYEESKTKAEKEYQSLDNNTKKMEKWFVSEFCINTFKNEYIQVCKNVSDVKDKLKTQNYLEYRNAMQIIGSTNNQLIRLNQIIKQNLNNSEKRLEAIFKTIEKEKNAANEKYSDAKLHFFLTIVYLILCLPLFYLVGSISDSLKHLPNIFFSFVGSFIFAIIAILILLGGVMGIFMALDCLSDLFPIGGSDGTNNFESEIIRLKQCIKIAKLSL